GAAGGCLRGRDGFAPRMCRRALRGCRRSLRRGERREPGLDDGDRLHSAHRAPANRRLSPSRVTHTRTAPADRVGTIRGRRMRLRRKTTASGDHQPDAEAAAGLALLAYELLDAQADTAHLAD